MSPLRFHIYIAGTGRQGRQFAALFEEACGAALPAGSFRIEIIDILREPARAEEYRVLATPTISRVSPAPERRTIGRISAEGAAAALQFLTDDLPNY
ncbi:circadian clock KaiB family protein [Flaviaesturariibacter aridisoli]|uniref:KaiB domain-containing protein n=1 Tax=Flaviaesturariibacter aridisoli TaxID=2545761 RepID=A0A4R4DUZ8_9BACT|nr:circadian clock KaiB family protein [Flaviaesturariibacter aridisoli]TCZ67058.1 hypothetical protein E0486_16355 [Flaviaesturariibacter aridisoli]